MLRSAKNVDELNSCFANGPIPITFFPWCEDINNTLMGYFGMKDGEVQKEFIEQFSDDEWSALGEFVCGFTLPSLDLFQNCVYYANTVDDLNLCLDKLYWDDESYDEINPEFVEDVCSARLGHLGFLFSLKDQDL